MRPLPQIEQGQEYSDHQRPGHSIGGLLRRAAHCEPLPIAVGVIARDPETRLMSWLPAATRYDGMSYHRCGRSGLKLPALAFGLWHNFGDASSFETCRAMLRRALDLGITHFDLANNYGPPPGSAEACFGRVFATDLRSHRDELILSTKAGY